MKELYVFLHIPKTAGTTFISILHKNFSIKNGEIMQWTQFNDKKNWGHLGQSLYEKLNCIHGHFSITDVELCPYFKNRKKIYMTLFRDPIDRVLSYWYFSAQPDKRNILDWLDMKEAPPNQGYNDASDMIRRENAAIKQITGNLNPTTVDIYNAILRVTRSDFIYGRTDIFDLFLEELQIKFPNTFRDIKYQKKLNVTKFRRPVKDHKKKVLNKIAVKNFLDIRLYELLFLEK